MAVTLQKLHRQLDQGQSSDLVNGNVASPPPAEVERLRQENTQYKQQVEVSVGTGHLCTAANVVVTNKHGFVCGKFY